MEYLDTFRWVHLYNLYTNYKKFKYERNIKHYF